MPVRPSRHIGAAVLLSAIAWGVPPAHAEAGTPSVAIVIDDMGNRLQSGLRAIRLAGPVTCAILPGTPHSKQLAEAAHRHGKQVMLHLPMEATHDLPLGPGGVTLHMTQGEFVRVVEKNLARIPHVRGVNNHMGSLLTRHPGHMQWLMEVLQGYPDLFFIDSRTTVRSVAQFIAHEHRIPNSRRDVFLDDDPATGAVARQFDRLLKLARRNGTAIGIGHPYATTLALLEERLPGLLERDGVRLVPVSKIVQLQRTEIRSWHASLSPLRKAAKSSKPLPSSICCVAPASKSLVRGLKPGR